LNWFFGTGESFSEYQFHGNIKWLPAAIVRLALLFSWSEKRCVTDAFDEAARRCQTLAVKTCLTTYQGFMGALTNYTHIFIPVLISQLQRRMQEIGGPFWEIDGFVPIAFDGSRNSAARTASNEAELCCSHIGQSDSAKYRKRKTKGMRRTKNEKNKPADPKPQAWITLMWHMGLRLPWDWRLGPSNSSERGHVQEMVETGQYPENTLFCGDAGFVGYDFWKSIVDRGYHFLVRVGGNVNLIGEDMNYKRVGDGEVLCWPHGKQSKSPPLRLRLVQVTIGKTKVFLLTSVLDREKLDRASMMQLYKKRWGVEVEFRGLKQTLKGSKLRCRNAARLYTELNWSILAMAIAELLALKEQIPEEKTADSSPEKNTYTPKKRSLANTMRAIYFCLDNLSEIPEPKKSLFERLACAVTDSYMRQASKAARYRPKNPDKKKLGEPKVRKIKTEERKKIEKIAQVIAA
jgi:hypothetical protein